MRFFLFIILFGFLSTAAQAAPDIPAARKQTVETAAGTMTFDKNIVVDEKTIPKGTATRLDHRFFGISDADFAKDPDEWHKHVMLARFDGETYSISCTSEPSGDPSCRFMRLQCLNNKDYKAQPLRAPYCEDEFSPEYPGTDFLIPGDGCIYVSGHANNNFNERRKYCYESGVFKERVQSLDYVGLTGEAQKDIVFYGNPHLQQPVGTVDKGQFIEVLIADPAYINADDQQLGLFMVRDAFGLAGWAVLRSGVQVDNGDVKGLYYNGD